MFNDYGHCDGCGHLYCICETGPAPKEEEMEIDMQLSDHLLTAEELAHNEHIDRKRAKKRRAVARDAYMAALGGLCAKGELSVTTTAEGAAILALETVRRWDAFMAAVDAEGGE